VRTESDSGTTMDYWASSVRVYGPAPLTEVTTHQPRCRVRACQGDLTDDRHHPVTTILDQVVSIRIKELERNVHVRAVVERHHQGETLLTRKR